MVVSKWWVGIVCILGMVGLAACKTPNQGSSTKNIEAIDLITRTSVQLYCDAKTVNGRSGCDTNGKVHYRTCGKFDVGRIDVAAIAQSRERLQIQIDFSALEKAKGENNQVQLLVELKVIGTKLQDISKDTERTVSANPIKPMEGDNCTGSSVLFQPIAYRDYIREVNQALMVMKADERKKLQEIVEESRKVLNVKFVLIESLLENIKSGRSSKAAYDKAIADAEQYYRELATLEVRLKSADAGIRMSEEVNTFLVKGGPDKILTSTADSVIYEAAIKPFQDRTELLKAERTLLRSQLVFQYAGKHAYVEGSQVCRNNGMRIAGRVEFVQLERFFNGNQFIQGWDKGSTARQQDDDPNAPRPNRMTGEFWVGTYAFDLSYALAVREMDRKAGNISIASAPFSNSLVRLANGAVWYLPANFHFISTTSTNLNSNDNSLGFNYGWYTDLESGQYGVSSALFGENEKKNVLCVKDNGYTYSDDVTKFAAENGLKGSKEDDPLRVGKLTADTYNFSRTLELMDYAAKGYQNVESTQRRPSTLWVCNASGQTFDFKQAGDKWEASPRTYNFHLLTALTTEDGERAPGLANNGEVQNFVVRQCENSNTNVIKGQGMCAIDVCSECVNILTGRKLNCNPKEKEDSESWKAGRVEQIKIQVQEVIEQVKMQ